jgi:FKBP-type peptidyl-prolyl cis-trans isomerase
MYDASAWRGTGRPYQMVLGGSGMILGVDQKLLNICVGERRVLYIPKP